MRIYLASSWRNARQPAVLAALRAAGHEVYDFRNPAPNNNGFGWKQCDPRPPAEWSVDDYLSVLRHPVARRGFKYDMDALRGCDVCVLVLPCGRSAHLELGWAAGAGKRTVVLCENVDEPELMYLMCDGIAKSVEELVTGLGGFPLPRGNTEPELPRVPSAEVLAAHAAIEHKPVPPAVLCGCGRPADFAGTHVCSDQFGEQLDEPTTRPEEVELDREILLTATGRAAVLGQRFRSPVETP